MFTLNKFQEGVICGRSSLIQLQLEHISFTLGAHLLVIFLWKQTCSLALRLWDGNQNTVSMDDWEIPLKVHSASKQKCEYGCISVILAFFLFLFSFHRLKPKTQIKNSNNKPSKIEIRSFQTLKCVVNILEYWYPWKYTWQLGRCNGDCSCVYTAVFAMKYQWSQWAFDLPCLPCLYGMIQIIHCPRHLLLQWVWFKPSGL